MAVWRARKDNGNARLSVGLMRCFLDEEKAKIAARLMRYMPRAGVAHPTQRMHAQQMSKQAAKREAIRSGSLSDRRSVLGDSYCMRMHRICMRGSWGKLQQERTNMDRATDCMK